MQSFYKNIGALSLHLILLVLIAPASTYAQTDADLMARLMQEEKEELEAIALYPREIRVAILEAASHPELLVRMQALQRQSSEEFKALLAGQEQETQEQLFELTRYPGLVGEMVAGGKKNRKELQAIADRYPEGIREVAVQHGQKNHSLLQGMDQLNLVTEASFAGLIKAYPETTQKAIEELTGQPEIMAILADNLNLTVLLGDLYRKDPAFVLAQTDSLAEQAAKKNAKELEDWKRQLEDDPEALSEFEAAAQQYAADNGYSEEDYRPRSAQSRVEVHHHYHPYPYWYGYPWWYNYPYSDSYYIAYGSSWWYAYPAWYPRPWSYHWGFYYGPGGNIVVWSLPSYHFNYWYFHQPQHHYYWPNYTNHCVRYNRVHRESASSLGRAVGKWERETEMSLGKDFLKDDNNRVVRIKEYGHLQSSVQQANSGDPRKALAPKDYLKSNSSTYPALSKSTIKSDYRAPVLQPSPSRPAPMAPVRSAAPVKMESRPPNPYQNLNRGKDYHQLQWQRQQVETRPMRQPQSQPMNKGGIKSGYPGSSKAPLKGR